MKNTLLIGLLCLAPQIALADEPGPSPSPTSPPPTRCGLTGTDEEKIADCRAKFPTSSEYCEINVNDRLFFVDCKNYELYAQDGFRLRRQVLVTRDHSGQVWLPAARHEPIGSGNAADDEFHALHPKLIAHDCGTQGTVEQRLQDCHAKSGAQGTLAKVCYLQGSSGAALRTVRCANAAAYAEDGLKIESWELITTKMNGKAAARAWRNVATGSLWSAPEPRIGSLMSYLGYNFLFIGTKSVCEDPEKAQGGKLGLQQEVVFIPAKCADLSRELAAGYLYLIGMDRAWDNTIAWCDSPGYVHGIDLASGTVHPFEGNPFADLSGICVSKRRSVSP